MTVLRKGVFNNFLNQKINTDQMQRGLYQMTQSREIFDYGSLSSVFCCSADLDGLDAKENFEYLATNCKTAVI